MSILSYQQALTLMLDSVRPLVESEEIATEAALGRVLAKSLVSPIDVPGRDNSAMDGYALRTSDLAGGDFLPLSQRIAAGDAPEPLAPGTAARIFTGAWIPDGADCVAMQEDCTLEENGVRFNKIPRAGQNIRRRGGDVRQDALVLAAGCTLRPQEMGLAAAVGFGSVAVYRKLKVAMLQTGNEIVMPGNPLPEGKIYNSNRYFLRGLLQALGCEIVDFGIVGDSLQATVEALAQAASAADVVLTSGGVSVGEEDYVKAAVERHGKLDMWKVAVKPGKPLAFGEVLGKPFIGLPGNPVSAFLVFLFFARPFLLKMQGASATAAPSFQAQAAFQWQKTSTRREWLRAKMADGAVEIHPDQGSGVLASLTWAEGVVEILPGQTVDHGDKVTFYPFAGFFS